MNIAGFSLNIRLGILCHVQARNPGGGGLGGSDEIPLLANPPPEITKLPPPPSETFRHTLGSSSKHSIRSSK